MKWNVRRDSSRLIEASPFVRVRSRSFMFFAWSRFTRYQICATERVHRYLCTDPSRAGRCEMTMTLRGFSLMCNIRSQLYAMCQPLYVYVGNKPTETRILSREICPRSTIIFGVSLEFVQDSEITPKSFRIFLNMKNESPTIRDMWLWIIIALFISTRFDLNPFSIGFSKCYLEFPGKSPISEKDYIHGNLENVHSVSLWPLIFVSHRHRIVWSVQSLISYAEFLEILAL